MTLRNEAGAGEAGFLSASGPTPASAHDSGGTPRFPPHCCQITGREPVLPVDPAAFVRGDGGDIFVFAYGSLIWNPGFPFRAAIPALLRGYHRALCIVSNRYRGTPERPGVVLGLDWGGSCRGMLYRVAAAEADAVIPYLWQREMLSNVYRPTAAAVMPLVEAATVAGAPKAESRADTGADTGAETGAETGTDPDAPLRRPWLRATTFVARREHRQYCGHVTAEEKVQLVRQGIGVAGSAIDYLHNTVQHLGRLGIPDRRLERLLAAARA